ncbi:MULTISPECIES: PP2C family protein-serine/threonine phosphatase [Paracoccus]|jgi:sigma-B regulation protein RsbU (phosphoserine phosphatase)|uniref:Response regulator receiver protein n=1 Tax=Paracoccus denitrificans (strain Pd 1222) TaxID=318586 RepID=A1AZB3_PARDP|nr:MULTISPECIES: fused response regulator/phosphatase [Paracoccus]ABL68607.1 response regulator receiver protein [Paracoccus denitrificans PD1222]MBB4625669.1 sigma-B regulation protein RsbU (phosphoserine phosphatase) [Paracoccus denitrificans]MCU7427162.1 fused response regulator/phosphatase [Paracoccus denitrificans]MDK8872046.1 fused response regulator/phosphatase [Paracoccus sp. SSJ]QAR26665.1 fused response regulator/phosphatase [Paracoccus denitrificans]
MMIIDAQALSSVPHGWRLVLLVDDSRAQRRTLAVQLIRAGYHVVEAASGDEAMRICLERRPDIVISDWMMPGQSGLEFCRRFREMQSDRYGYFILLTSRNDKKDIAEGLRAGADEFLTKPVSGAELLARLSASERILRMEESLRSANARLNSTLTRLRETQAAIDRDLREAQRLQQGLVRERHGRYGDFDLSLLMRPAGHIGGDLVGFFPINARRVGLFALDVAGHGVASALLCARLAALLSGAADQNIALRITELGLCDARPPAEILHHLNTLMIEELRTESYFTMVYADLDFLTGALRLVQAGHPHPVLQRADGRIESIGRGGLPVGVFSHAAYEEVQLVLDPGDRLFISSDGLSESENARGEPLGEDGLHAILRTNATLRGDSLLESICWSAAHYAGGQRNDDISAVLIERRQEAGQTWG